MSLLYSIENAQTKFSLIYCSSIANPEYAAFSVFLDETSGKLRKT
jgi:hypothetical protein